MTFTRKYPAVGCYIFGWGCLNIFYFIDDKDIQKFKILLFIHIYPIAFL